MPNTPYKYEHADPPRPPRWPMFREGVLPARVYPDNMMNLYRAGLHKTLQPENTPVQVAAGGDATAIITQSSKFDYFLLTRMATVWSLTDQQQTPGAVNSYYNWLCRFRIDGYEWWDNTWLHQSEVFGTGRYPGDYAMPLVMHSASVLEILLRNLEAFDIYIAIELRGTFRVVEVGAEA